MGLLASPLALPSASHFVCNNLRLAYFLRVGAGPAGGPAKRPPCPWAAIAPRRQPLSTPSTSSHSDGAPAAHRPLQALMVRFTKEGTGADGLPHLQLPPIVRRQLLVEFSAQDLAQYQQLLSLQQHALLGYKQQVAASVSYLRLDHLRRRGSRAQRLPSLQSSYLPSVSQH